MDEEIRKLQERKKKLLESAKVTKEKKQGVIKIVQDLLSQYNSGRLSKQEHDEKLRISLDKRSSEQWVKYYDDFLAYYDYQIKLCDRLIREDKLKFVKGKIRANGALVLKILIVLVLLGLIVSVFFIFKPKLQEYVEGIEEEGTLATQAPVFVDSGVEIIDESLVQYQAVLGKPVKWKKEFVIDSVSDFNVELPEGSENIKVTQIKEGGEQDISSIVKVNKKGIFRKRVEVGIDKKTITGNAILDVGEGEIGYEIEFETPAPEIIEEEISKGKRITIRGPDDVHYENILSFTKLAQGFSDAGSIKVYEIKNGKRISTQFSVYDTDEDGEIDFIEWITPYLSEAVFEIIIEISKAEHLDSDKIFISDIYEQVKAQDDVWSEEIKDNEYVRVTFEEKLDNSKDITIYLRVVSGNPKIEVYEIEGNEIIAEFENLVEGKNTIYLTALEGVQDTFDLRIVDGSLEIDYIVDPYALEFVKHVVDDNFNGATSIYAGDLDNDGDIDVIGVADGEGTLSLWENELGDGSSWAKYVVDTGITGIEVGSVYSEDIDGDNNIDILLITNNGKVVWWENDGTPFDAGWIEHEVEAIGGFNLGRAVYAKDVDNDNNMDILGAGGGGGAGEIAWWENELGDGSSWTKHIIVDTGFSSAFSVYAIDLDDDTDIDVLGASAGGDIVWWENVNGGDGLITWTRHDIGTIFGGAEFVRAADLNNDGYIDVLGAGGNNLIWWAGDGIGNFGNGNTIDTDFIGSSSFYVEDIDGDLDMDIVGAADVGDEIIWWENELGDGSFWTKHILDSNFDGASSIYAGDIDNDGDIDILGAADNNDAIAWWENAHDYGAGIVLDSVSSAQSSGTNLNWNHELGYGINRVLVVTSAIKDEDDSDILDITLTSPAGSAGSDYGPVSFTYLGSEEWPDPNSLNGRNEIWYMLEKDLPQEPGTYTIKIIYPVIGDYTVAGAMSLENVAQEVPVYNSFSYSNLPITTDITTTENNAWVVDVINIIHPGRDDELLTTEQGQVKQWREYTGLDYSLVAGSTKLVEIKGLTNMGWDEFTGQPTSLTEDSIIHSLVAFNPYQGEQEKIEELKECSSAMVGYWNFDENGGDIAYDYVGQNHGDLINMEEEDWVEGQVYSGLDFDGVDEYVDIGNINEVEGISELTVCSWISTSMAGSGGIVGKNSLNDHTWLLNKDSSDVAEFYITNTIDSWDASISGTTIINDGNWYYVCGVYQGANDLKLYVNGVSEGLITGTEPTIVGRNLQPITIGVFDTTRFDGQIDEVAIYDRALSSQEIKYIYENSFAGYGYCDDLNAPDVEFVKPTKEEGSAQNWDDIVVNVSAGDINDISVFIDFDNSLVGWWRMDDIYSGEDGWPMIYDNSTYGNDGVVSGVDNHAHQVDGGYLGKGFEFDGDGDYVDVGNDASLMIDEFTVSVWINPYARGGTILDKSRFSSENGGYSMQINPSGEIYFAILAGGGTGQSMPAVGPSISLNEWIHVVVTSPGGVIDQGDVKIYYNGVEQEVIYGYDGYAMKKNSLNLYIGSESRSPEQYPFEGIIDDVMIFNRSLSKEEIQALYANKTTDYLIQDFTNLIDGDYVFKAYVFKAYAQDRVGNVNVTEERKIIIDSIPPDINLTLPTPKDGSIFDILANDIFVNVSATDVGKGDNNISTFIDFDNSLVGWWRMDDIGGESYQEGADGFSFDGSLTNPTYADDGDWDSYTTAAGTNEGNVYMDYSNPSHYEGKVEIKWREGNGAAGICELSCYGNSEWNLLKTMSGPYATFHIENITLLPNCVSEDTLQLKVYCEDLFDFMSCARFYEVAVWWADGGNLILDLSTYSNHGIAFGDAHQVDGVLGKGFEFDGDGDKIKIPHNSNQAISNTGTWAFWLKLNSYYQQTFVSKRDDWSINNAWAMGIDYGSPPPCMDDITFEFAPDGTGTTKTEFGWDRTNIPLGEWVFVTFVYNSGDTTRNVRMYLNSTEIDPFYVDNRNAPLFESTSDIYIGTVNDGTGWPLDGIIDDVMIFNRSLSVGEIQALYANTSSTYLIQDFNDLISGNHVFRAYVQDIAGNVNMTEDRTITITGLDPPEIVYVSDILNLNPTTLLIDRDLSPGAPTQKSFRFYVYSEAGPSVLPSGTAITDTNVVISLVNIDLVKKGGPTGAGIIRKSRAIDGGGGCVREEDAFPPQGAPHEQELAAVYVCTVNMQHYDDFGFFDIGLGLYPNWNVSAYVQDIFEQDDGFNPVTEEFIDEVARGDVEQLAHPNSATYFNELVAQRINYGEGFTLNFAGASIGTDIHIQPTVVSSPPGGDYPLVIENIGNSDINFVNLKSYDLPGLTYPTEYIQTHWFSVGDGDLFINSQICSSQYALGNTQNPGDSNSVWDILPDIPYGDPITPIPQDSLSFCLREVQGPLLAQDYSTGGNKWDINFIGLSFILSIIKFINFNLGISFLIISVRIKSKKRKKKKKSLKKKYDLNERDLLVLDSQLKEKYNIGIEELLEVSEQRGYEGEVQVPVFIFNQHISPAEVLCKYLKENLGLNFREIGKLINRDERTVWVNYRNAVKKMKGKIRADKKILVSINIFANRKLSILENVINYLKEKEFRNFEIAEMLGKDQRNISTLYSRARKKIG